MQKHSAPPSSYIQSDVENYVRSEINPPPSAIAVVGGNRMPLTLKRICQ